MFENTILIGLGGALGALMRFWISSGVAVLWGRGFPFGTLIVNILGSLLIGILYVLFAERMIAAAGVRALLVVGLLGALTTFSAFSIETLQLIEGGELWKALVNVSANVMFCLFACWVGLAGARQF